MDIVFASDRNYIAHLAVAMHSLFANNPRLRFNVHVVNSDIDQRAWQKLESIVTSFGHQLSDIRIRDRDLDGVVLNHHFTKANYYRLFIADELWRSSTALYLDSDIVVNGPIDELLQIDLSTNYLAAVISPGFDGHHDLDMSAGSKYFNSGVMLLNLARWRADGVKDKVIDFVRRKPSVIRYVDQCGINAIVDGRWTEVHPKFNVQTCFFAEDTKIYAMQFPDGDMAAACQNPVIIHYTGSLKPWHLRDTHPYRAEYWRYLRATPFNYYLPKDVNLTNVARWTSKRIQKMIYSKRE